MSEYFTEEVITKTVKTLNTDKVKQDIELYLKSHAIDGVKYYVTSILYESTLDYLTIKLLRHNWDEPDEDFESDKGWDEFLDDLAKKCSIRRAGVPGYYYPK